jgi:hypothetical protein
MRKPVYVLRASKSPSLTPEYLKLDGVLGARWTTNIDEASSRESVSALLKDLQHHAIRLGVLVVASLEIVKIEQTPVTTYETKTTVLA